MIQFNEISEIVAESFFNGNVEIAGIIVFSAVMGFIFMIFGRKSLTVPFVMMLPTTLIFTELEIIPESLTVLLIIVSVLALAMVARDKVAN